MDRSDNTNSHLSLDHQMDLWERNNMYLHMEALACWKSYWYYRYHLFVILFLIPLLKFLLMQATLMRLILSLNLLVCFSNLFPYSRLFFQTPAHHLLIRRICI